MKKTKILTSAILAVAFLLAFIVGIVVAVGYNTATARYATPIMDGVKDRIYNSSVPVAVGNDTDAVSGTAYFAFDTEYIYVFVEVKDATVASRADKYGVIGASTYAAIGDMHYNDCVSLGINLGTSDSVSVNVWNNNDGTVTDLNDEASVWCVVRGRNGIQHEGGHAHAPAASAIAANSSLVRNFQLADAKTLEVEGHGYNVEMKIPFGRTYDGQLRDVDSIFESGISFIVQIGDTAVNPSDPTKNLYDNYYVMSNAEFSRTNIRGTAHKFGSGYDKLIFADTYSEIEAPETLAGVTLDAVREENVYVSAPIYVGDDLASAYFAYDESNLYLYVDVNDETRQSVYYRQNWAAQSSSLGSISQSHFNWNDSVAIGLNFGDTNCGVDDGYGSSALAGVYGTYRGLGTTTTHSVKVGAGQFYTASNALGAAVNVTEKADNSGYTVEFKFPFTSQATLQTAIDNGISFCIQVTDVNGAQLEQLAFSNRNFAKMSYGSVYKWHDGTAIRTYNTGYDKLVMIPVDTTLTITSPANKLSYLVGETLDLTGLALTAIHKQGDIVVGTETPSLSECSVTYGDDATPSSTAFTHADSGTVTVTVTWENISTSFDVEVVPTKVMVNQLGYLNSDNKVASVVGSAQSFSLVRVSDNSIVFSGNVTQGVYDAASGDVVAKCDFSSHTTPGEYYILVDGAVRSYNFEIGNDVYDVLVKDLIKTVFYQRCGYTLPENYTDSYAHAACHMNQRCLMSEKVNGLEVSCGMDLSGGWHDAGDFSVQVTSTSLTASMLMYIYELYPDIFDDNVGIPESGNNVPDILDEAKWGITWLMKMQTASGGVLRRTDAWGQPPLTTQAQNDTSTMYVYPVCYSSTGNMVAVCAQAARVFSQIDSEFAQQCLTAAQNGYNWMLANPGYEYQYPGNYYGATTEYIGESELDELLWAKAELYATTSNLTYLDGISSLISSENLTGMSYHDRGGMAVLALVATQDTVWNETAAQTLTSAYVRLGNLVASQTNNCQWNVAADTTALQYHYNFNLRFAMSELQMILAERFDSTVDHSDRLMGSVNFALGNNPLNFCFVSGYGTDSVQNLHHRMEVAGNMFPGVVAPGPGTFSAVKSSAHSNLDEYLPSTTPPLKCYYDDISLYRFNEWTVDATCRHLWIIADAITRLVP